MSLDQSLVKEKENKVLDFLFYWGRPIRVGDLVKELEIKHSTLNSVLHRLVENGLVSWSSYGPVELTEKGKEEAAHLSNHHFIIEHFLKQTLDLTESDVHHEALNLAGVASCALIEAICRKFNICHDTSNQEYCTQRTYLK
jgi:DtxR family Mn-dependent transcriptional regulator